MTCNANRACFSDALRWRINPRWLNKKLGSVDVHDFSKIRFVANERVGSATGINIQLSGGGVGAQLDTLSLAPHLQVTWVNDVRQGS
jgi:type III secretion protein HrpB1